MKKALITGITGQDGAYLAETLLENGYEVFGTHRPTNNIVTWRLEQLGILNHPKFSLYASDQVDLSSCKTMIEKIAPDEIYNLSAQSSVAKSFKDVYATVMSSGLSALNLLEAIRVVNSSVRFFQASSADLFGKCVTSPQNEKTTFNPQSPYAVAKLFAHHCAVNYRECHGIYAASGILFNHDSPLRSKDFVTRKITNAVAKISLGYQDVLVLGNLDVTRDWGYAKDYVDGMYRMMQHDVPDTFILATNRTASVRDFVDLAFKVVDINLLWEGSGINSCAFDRNSGRLMVRVDEQFYRPREVENLMGDATKALNVLGWQANTRIEQLCKIMVSEDLYRVEQQLQF
jgi:GDPmannose 4,6-dehydratase